MVESAAERAQPLDVFVVPNGGDHVAMQRAAPAVRRHMDRGGALLCFGGWSTPWVPGNRWLVANASAPLDARLRVRDFDALVVPFQSNHAAIAERRDAVYRLLADGKTVAVFGDTSPAWIDAQWEWRPTNNWWWVDDPTRPPIAHTDFTHPLFKGLAQRHACWHTRGAYTRLSPAGRVLQLSDRDEAITWETHEYGGTLLASTLDPIVEHGVQQIRHLDHFCDNLTAWLCGVRPAGRFEVDAEAYGRPWAPA